MAEHVQSISNILEKKNSKIKEPKRYRVIMHNDDFTTMDFVVEILMNVFHKDKAEALVLTLAVHENQKATVGIYSYDMASTRTAIAMDLAKKAGYPFQVTIEEA